MYVKYLGTHAIEIIIMSYFGLVFMNLTASRYFVLVLGDLDLDLDLNFKKLMLGYK